MSIEALNYYRTVRFGDRYPSRKLLMILLADRADEDYSCFPSIGLLADEMETDRRAIQRLLSKLMEDGYLSVEDRKRDNKSTASNRYHLHGPWDGWAATEGKPFEVIESKRKGYTPKPGNFRPRRTEEKNGEQSSLFPLTEGGGYETAPGAVTRPQGGGYETAGGAVSGPPLESSVEPPQNHHPEHSLRAARSEAALPGGESEPGEFSDALMDKLLAEFAPRMPQQPTTGEVLNLPGGGALLNGHLVGPASDWGTQEAYPSAYEEDDDR